MTFEVDLELVLTFLSILVIVLGAVIAVIKSYSNLSVIMTIVQKDLIEIKNSHKDYDKDIKDLNNRMVAAESSASSAHKRMDDHHEDHKSING